LVLETGAPVRTTASAFTGFGPQRSQPSAKLAIFRALLAALTPCAKKLSKTS
jgi:hypothetical protein